MNCDICPQPIQETTEAQIKYFVVIPDYIPFETMEDASHYIQDEVDMGCDVNDFVVVFAYVDDFYEAQEIINLSKMF